MEAALADYVWSIEEVVGLWIEASIDGEIQERRAWREGSTGRPWSSWSCWPSWSSWSCWARRCHWRDRKSRPAWPNRQDWPTGSQGPHRGNREDGEARRPWRDRHRVTSPPEIVRSRPSADRPH